jgi:predicted PurR-regulated permease PerM
MLIIAVFLLLLLPEVFRQLELLLSFFIQTIPREIKVIIDRIKGNLTPEQEEYIAHQLELVELNLKDFIQASLPGLKSLASGSATVAGAVGTGFMNLISSVVGFFTFLSFVAVISFYMIIDFSKIKPAIEPMVPPRHRERFFDIMNKVDIAVGGFLRGQLIDCTMVGMLIAVCLLIAGFKEYALIIGLIAGVGNIVPYLGPILGATPAVLLVLFSPEYAGLGEKVLGLLIVAGIFIFVQSVEGFVFQPKIVGKNSQLHPLLVLFGLMVGAQFGMWGLIVAIPVTAGLRVIIAELVWKPRFERHQVALADGKQGDGQGEEGDE